MESRYLAFFECLGKTRKEFFVSKRCGAGSMTTEINY